MWQQFILQPVILFTTESTALWIACVKTMESATALVVIVRVLQVSADNIAILVSSALIDCEYGSDFLYYIIRLP